jgi:hypothetical protein
METALKESPPVGPTFSPQEGVLLMNNPLTIIDIISVSASRLTAG